MESVPFPQLIQPYAPTALRIARRLLGDADAAADAVQVGLIKAYRARAGFQGKNLRTWFLRIVTNTCYDQIGYARRRPAVSLDALIEEYGENLPIVRRDSSPSIEELICRQETWAVLLQAIATLPPAHRVVLQRIDVEGYSYAEVAAELYIPIGTVKSRLFRARAQVRDQLVDAGLVAASPAAARPALNCCPTPNDSSLTTQQKGDLCT